jgi:pimeloyl-[acyl-carrier protein] synthase
VALEPDRGIHLPPLFGPEMLADPYPVYHQLRAAEPVHWHEPFAAWILTRYDDVWAGLHDPRLSAKRTVAMQAAAGRPELQPFFTFLADRMVFTDPPQHTRLRALVSQTFKPHILEALRPHIQTLVDGFLDRVEKQRRMDVIADLAFPLPATVIAEVLGVPPEDLDQLKEWSDEFILVLSSDPTTIPAEVYGRCARAAQAMTDYFRGIVNQRRAEPRNDLLTLLELVEEQGDRLSESELFATANLVLVAGHETTTNLIGNGLLALLRHPEQLRKLREDPALVPHAVEELFRYDSPVQFVYRIAREDMQIAGKTIRRGQTVHLVLAAANRDPAHFPDPDRLDITRTPGRHLALGQGIHYCLGAPLARLEGQVAFETLLRRMPNLRLASGEVEHHANFNLRGLKALPVVF